VAAAILGTGRAAPVTVEASERVRPAGLQDAAEHVSISHDRSIVRLEPTRSRTEVSNSDCVDFRPIRSLSGCAGANVARAEEDDMATDSPWPTIHSEREALADDLSALTDEQWATTSMCDGWSVRSVLGHMTATASMTPPAFFAKLIGSGFRFNAMVEKHISEQVEGTPADTLARFRAQLTSVKHPPGPVLSWLGETVVHAEDIRRPLGITHAYPPDALIRLADFYKNSNTLIGAKKRITGLHLKATDADWSTGTGPEVSGPMISLVLAMTGRRPAVDDLTGEGVKTLAARE
jgi:uncharacterized protein (TIGR03083 family)